MLDFDRTEDASRLGFRYHDGFNVPRVPLRQR